jgi:hypothetical protein
MEQFGFLADRARVSRSIVERAARDMVDRMQANWRDAREQLPFDDLRLTIDDQFQKTPLFNPERSSISVPEISEEDREEIS